MTTRSCRFHLSKFILHSGRLVHSVFSCESKKNRSLPVPELLQDIAEDPLAALDNSRFVFLSAHSSCKLIVNVLQRLFFFASFLPLRQEAELWALQAEIVLPFCCCSDAKYAGCFLCRDLTKPA